MSYTANSNFRGVMVFVRTTHSSASYIYSANKNGSGMSLIQKFDFGGQYFWFYTCGDLKVGDKLNINVNSGTWQVFMIYYK